MQEENLTNNELVKLFQKTKDEKYFNKLFNNNQGLIQKIVSEHSYIYDKSFSVIEKEDAVAVANYAFFQAVKTFDESKGFAFSTYFSHCCENELGHLYLYVKRHEFPTVSTEEKAFSADENSEVTLGDLIPDVNSNKGFASINDKMISEKIMAKIKKYLRPAEYYVFKHVMEKSKTLVEIGKECNVSRQRVNNLYISAKRKLMNQRNKIDRYLN